MTMKIKLSRKSANALIKKGLTGSSNLTDSMARSDDKIRQSVDDGTAPLVVEAPKRGHRVSTTCAANMAKQATTNESECFEHSEEAGVLWNLGFSKKWAKEHAPDCQIVK